MQRSTRRLQPLPAACQVDRVVAVPSIRGASTGAHEPARPQLTEVVRHEALLHAEELCQLPYGTVAVRQLPQQLPTNRMRHEPQEPRCIAGCGP